MIRDHSLAGNKLQEIAERGTLEVQEGIWGSFLTSWHTAVPAAKSLQRRADPLEGIVAACRLSPSPRQTSPPLFPSLKTKAEN
jgi:hypothetical protein